MLVQPAHDVGALLEQLDGVAIGQRPAPERVVEIQMTSLIMDNASFPNAPATRARSRRLYGNVGKSGVKTL